MTATVCASQAAERSDPDCVSGIRTKNAVGAVFCGGRSKRMGRDKARLALGDGATLLERAVGVLAPLSARVVLACGPEARYGELQRELVLDGLPDGGPLAGLEAALSALREGSEEWLLALACDMPRVRPELFRLLGRRAVQQQADACLLAGPRGVEPLVAVYHRRVLEAVRSALAAGERRMIAFHEGHGPVRVARLEERELPADLALSEPARNVNTPDDWRREGGRG